MKEELLSSCLNNKQTYFLMDSIYAYSLVIILPKIGRRFQFTRELLGYEPKHLTYFKIPSMTGIIILGRIFLQPKEKIIYFFHIRERVGGQGGSWLMRRVFFFLTVHFLVYLELG